MICLNSIIEFTGRISTMLRTLRASTPVESFCDVVRMVGMVFSLSWKMRRNCSPRFAVPSGDADAVIRLAAGLRLIDEVPHGGGVILGGAENERLLRLVDRVHEELDAIFLARGDLDDAVEFASRRSASRRPAAGLRSARRPLV